MKQATNVVIYSRVSTVKQEASMQLRECKAFCKRAGWNVVEVLTDTASGSDYLTLNITDFP